MFSATVLVLVNMYTRTRDHDLVQSWIEEKGGIPVSLPEGEGDQISVYFGTQPLPEGYESVSWEDFFNRFDTLQLAFRYFDGPETPEEFLEYQFVAETDPMLGDEETEDETVLLEVAGGGAENAYGQMQESD